jgi:NADPH:quinone reductase-like Zn-dependent oxidoreductase
MWLAVGGSDTISTYIGSSKGLSIRDYWLAEIVTNPDRLARAKSYVHVKTGQLRPTIAKTFRFEDVVNAYQYMESNKQIGKIVLTVGD